MVKFCKNGSNATSAAVKIARAYTGRPIVCIPRQHPFFSFDDWFIGTTPVSRGVSLDASKHTTVFDFNDLGSLENLFSQFPGQIAAVMMEPSTHLTPCYDGYCPSSLDEIKSKNCRTKKKTFYTKFKVYVENMGAYLFLTR